MNYWVSKMFLNSKVVNSNGKAFEMGAKFSVSDDGVEAPVYVMQLVCVLESTKVPIEGSKKTFNGKKFISFYVQGFKEGVQYFMANHNVSNDVLYSNSEQYIKDLHVCYFHNDPITNNKKGWNWYQQNYPITISNEHVKKFGFYAGIISELEKMKLKFPALFRNFKYKCELEQKGKKKEQKNVSHTKSLKEIWTKDEEHYNKVMEFLKEVSPTVGCSFINDKYQWQKFKNSIKYLAAFTKMCILKEYIQSNYSAPEYQRIYNKTFAIEFNPKPFQSIVTKDFNGFLDPFINIP